MRLARTLAFAACLAAAPGARGVEPAPARSPSPEPKSEALAGAPARAPAPGFRLFPVLASLSPTRLDLSFAGKEKKLSVRLPGDPDSVFSLGGPTPVGVLALRAAVEVNDLVLRASPQEPNFAPNDARGRSAGSWTLLDNEGRPYQFRLGARLVW